LQTFVHRSTFRLAYKYKAKQSKHKSLFTCFILSASISHPADVDNHRQASNSDIATIFHRRKRLTENGSSQKKLNLFVSDLL